MKKKRKKLKSTKKKKSEKEKNEKGEALGAFKVVSYYDNLHYEEIATFIIEYSGKGENKYYKVLVPNIPVIKQNIESELRKQIASNNSKHKLSCFITIKYLMLEYDELEQKSDIITRYFNSYIISLTSSHVISGFINDMITAFEIELENAKFK